MGNGTITRNRPIRQRVDEPQNSHIHRGLSPFFIARDAERHQRIKLLFRANLIEHRLRRRPELLATNGSYQALHCDANDIRKRHGRKMSRA